MQPVDRETHPRRPLEPSAAKLPGSGNAVSRAWGTAAAAAVVLLVLPLVPAPAGAAEAGAAKPHEPGGGQVVPDRAVEQVADDGGEKPRARACCQYVCRDKVSDYLLVVCVERTGCQETFNFAQCQLLARNDVASCKECPPQLDRGRGRGNGEGGHCPKPAEEKQPDAAPGGAGGGGAPKQ